MRLSPSRFGLPWLVASTLAIGAALPAAAATIDGYKVAFVTSTSGRGNLGDTNDAGHWVETNGTGLQGLEAADRICQVRAEAGGLATAGAPLFRAWISDAVDDAYCRVQGLEGRKSDGPPCAGGTLTGAGPWVLVDGRPFAPALDTLTAMVPSTVYVPATVTETGGTALSDAYYTGTLESGAAVAADHRCSEWTDGTLAQDYAGGRTDSAAFWSSGSTSSCANELRLLCLEEGPGTVPPLPSAPGALAFVSSATGEGDLGAWPDAGGESGLAAGDAICQSLAGAAGLPSPQSFVAWLSDGATDAKDRLTLDGPWRRLDGFEIAASKVDLLDGFLAAPISLDETASLRLDEVWTGSTSAGLKSAELCNDWASDGSDTGFRGSSYRTHGYWTDFNGDESCSTARRLYCFANVVTIFWNRFEPEDPFAWSATLGGP